VTRLLLGTAAALAVAAPAQAKGPVHASVCGETRCKQVSSPRDVDRLVRLGYSSTPAAPGPYYVLRLTRNVPEGPYRVWKVFYVPGADLFATLDERIVRWHQARSGEALRELLAGVEPFPAPAIREVYVGGRPARGEAQAYLGLFAARGRSPEESVRDWLAVDLVAGTETPWSASDRDLMFSPSTGILERGTQQLVIGPLVAAERGPAWRTAALGLAGAAIAIAFGAAARRRLKAA
jgi:hypothetical protein